MPPGCNNVEQVFSLTKGGYMREFTVAAALCLLAACASGGTKTSTTTSSTTMSVRQVASIIAEAAPQIRGEETAVHDCAVRSIGTEPCDVSEQLAIDTLSLQVKTLLLELDKADPVPQEIAALVERTKAHAHDLQDAGDHFQSLKCSEPPVDNDCGPTFLRIRLSYDPLISDFDAWAPYI